MGIQGPPGPDAVEFLTAVPGPTGPRGPQGYQGRPAPVSPDQASTGSQGYQGSQGYKGMANTYPGLAGPIGDLGFIGRMGTMGPQGPMGNQGPQASPSSLPIMLFTLSDDAPGQGPQGYIGMQGEQGKSSKESGYQGYVGLQGDGAVSPAPSGYQGNQGPNGPDAQALIGPQGYMGQVGPVGWTGSQGSQGPDGNPGPIGMTGPPGETGYQGEEGESITGPTGYDGPMGPQGWIGNVGETGSMGYQGIEGPTGPTPPFPCDSLVINENKVGVCDGDNVGVSQVILSTTTVPVRQATVLNRLNIENDPSVTNTLISHDNNILVEVQTGLGGPMDIEGASLYFGDTTSTLPPATMTSVGGNSSLGTSSNGAIGAMNSALGTLALAQAQGSADEMGNVALGYSAMTNHSTGGMNTAIGNNALLQSVSGICNTAIGDRAMFNCVSDCRFNTAVGAQTLSTVTTCERNTALGAYCMFGYQGNDSIGIGQAACSAGIPMMAPLIGNGNIALGRESLFNCNSANECLGIGDQAIRGISNTSRLGTLQDVICIGNSNGLATSAPLPTNANDTVIGIGAISTNLGNTGIINNIFMGYNSGARMPVNASDNVMLSWNHQFSASGPTSGSRNTAAGLTALNNLQTGSNNTTFGAFSQATLDANANCTTIGADSMRRNTLDGSTSIGRYAMSTHNSGVGSGVRGTAVGYQAMSNPGTHNVALGESAMGMPVVFAHFQNTAIGAQALRIGNTAALQNMSNNNVAIGTATLTQAARVNGGNGFNVAIGAFAAQTNVSGTQTVAIGAQALQQLNSGFGNTVVGYQGMPSLVTGSQNTVLGHSTDAPSLSAASWSLILGAGAEATQNNQFVLGDQDFRNANVTFDASLTSNRFLRVKIGSRGYQMLMSTEP